MYARPLVSRQRREAEAAGRATSGEFHYLMAELNERFGLALGQREREVGHGVPVGWTPQNGGGPDRQTTRLP